MNSLKIDEDKCLGCQACYEACWVDVIRWDADRAKPVAAYPEDCVGCNFCEVSCPEEAIKVVIDYALPFPYSSIDGQA